MPYINGGPIERWAGAAASSGGKAKKPKFGGAGEKIKGAAGRAKAKAGPAFGNATSEKGTRGRYGTKGAFGQKTYEHKDNDTMARLTSGQIGFVGGVAGGVAATPVSGHKLRNQKNEHAFNQKVIARNSGKIRAQNRAAKTSVSKGKYKLITDVGTAAGRSEERMTGKYPLLSKPALAGGAVAGVTLAAGSRKLAVKQNEKGLNRQRKTIANQQKKLGISKGATMNPFGVDHEVISKDKYKDKNVVGAAGAAYGGSVVGGLTAGVAASGGPKGYKRNFKTAMRVGQDYASGPNFQQPGDTPGSAYKAARANNRGVKNAVKAVPELKRMRTAGMAGSAVGAAAGVGAYLHTKKKNAAGRAALQKSAFGVEHEVSKAKAKENHKPMSGGRVVSGALFAPVHGAVAGKKGHKLKATGSEAAGVVAGRAIGGMGGSPGYRAAGALGGAVAGTKFAHTKGWLKRQDR